MRLFVGLSLPETVRWQLTLLCGGLPGVRWVPAENFHITLRFLGEIDGGQMHDVDAALAGLRAPRFCVALSGVGHFGSGSQIRALWAGVAREPALQHLRDKVESAVVRAGLPPEGKKFTPHVTLSHSKSLPSPKLQIFLAQHSLFRTAPFEITHFTLFSSYLGHEHATYHAERSYELSRGSAAGSGLRPATGRG